MAQVVFWGNPTTPGHVDSVDYFMSGDVMEVAHELRVPVRLYIPFGEAWLPYALGQIVRTPRMLSWVMRDMFNATFGPG